MNRRAPGAPLLFVRAGPSLAAWSGGKDRSRASEWTAMQEASRRSVKRWKGRQLLVAPRARVGSLAADRPRRLPLCVPRGKQIQLSGRVSLAVGGGLWPVAGSWPCPRDCYLAEVQYQKLANPNPTPTPEPASALGPAPLHVLYVVRAYIAPGGRYQSSPARPAADRNKSQPSAAVLVGFVRLRDETSTRRSARWASRRLRASGPEAVHGGTVRQRILYSEHQAGRSVYAVHSCMRERSCRPTGY
jgi:hypothetical protein